MPSLADQYRFCEDIPPSSQLIPPYFFAIMRVAIYENHFVSHGILLISHSPVGHKQLLGKCGCGYSSARAITYWQQLILMKVAQTIAFRASSRKFYEVAEERRHRNLPKTPEEAILSKYLKNEGAYRTFDTPARSTASGNTKPQSNKIRYR